MTRVCVEIILVKIFNHLRLRYGEFLGHDVPHYRFLAVRRGQGSLVMIVSRMVFRQEEERYQLSIDRCHVLPHPVRHLFRRLHDRRQIEIVVVSQLQI